MQTRKFNIVKIPRCQQFFLISNGLIIIIIICGIKKNPYREESWSQTPGGSGWLPSGATGSRRGR
jgi:hypothetical protein